MSQLKRLNLQGQIKNETRFSYLGHLSVCLNQGSVHLSLVEVIAYVVITYFKLLYLVASYRLLDLDLRI